MRETLHFGSDFPFAAVQHSLKDRSREFDTTLPEDPEDDVMEENDNINSTTLEVQTLYAIGQNWLADQSTSMGGKVLDRNWNDEDMVYKQTREALQKAGFVTFDVRAARFLHEDFVQKTKKESRFEDGGPFSNYTFTNEQTEEEINAGLLTLKTTWIIKGGEGSLSLAETRQSLIEEMMKTYPNTRSRTLGS